MARKQTTAYISDLTQKGIPDDEAMTVRLEYVDEKQRSYWTLDVSKSDVSELMEKGEEHKKRGRAPGTKVGPRKPKADAQAS